MARTTSPPRPHALAHALPRAAGFALLRPASRPQLDATRIITLSGTIAINLLAMGLLMMPLAMPTPAIWEAPETRHPTRDIPREKPVEVEIVKRAITAVPPIQPVRQQTVAPADRQSAHDAVVAYSGNERIVEDTIAEDAGPATDYANTVSAAPTAVQLEYLSAPALNYPRGALLRQVEGTVLLQVLVGIDGRPLEVTVSQSSGNRELDDAARSQILKRWSFRPAMRNGQAVQAIGLVPVAFSLRR